MSAKTKLQRELTPAGRLSEAGVHGLLGYQLAQAAVVTTASFTQQIGQVFELRPVEFTLLALVDGNPGVSAGQLADALAVTPPNITLAALSNAERAILVELLHRVAMCRRK